MLAKGEETPENHSLSVVRGFFYRLVMELIMKPTIEKVGKLLITLLIQTQ